MNSTYKGKVVTLRHFYSGSKLVYNSDGSLVKGGPVGPWTLDGDIEIHSIHLKRSKMTIDGNRLWVAFVDNGEKFYQADGVTIEVETNRDPMTLSDLVPIFWKICLTPQENLASFVPDYWRAFLAPGNPDIAKPLEASSSGDYSKSGVVAPRSIHTPEPSYTDAARKLGIEGTAVFVIIVGIDSRVHRVVVSRPLGLGLDDEVAETLLRDWKFQPAVKNGKPVPTRITVQISFRLR